MTWNEENNEGIIVRDILEWMRYIPYSYAFSYAALLLFSPGCSVANGFDCDRSRVERVQKQLRMYGEH